MGDRARAKSIFSKRVRCCQLSYTKGALTSCFIASLSVASMPSQSFSPTTTSTPPPPTTFSSGTDSTSESLHWSSALSSRDIAHTILQGGGKSDSPPLYPARADHDMYTSHTASSIITAPSGAQTAVATTSRRASSLRRPAFIGASAGLSAAAFVTIIAVVLLFRRDRRLTRGAKLARLSQPRSVDLFGYASSEGLQQSGIAGADGLPGDCPVTVRGTQHSVRLRFVYTPARAIA